MMQLQVKPIVFVCFYVLLLGCRSERTSPSGATSDNGVKPIITVSAAASTAECLRALANQYERRASVLVKINAGATSSLANQVIAGSPAHLFLSASVPWANAVDKEGLCRNRVDLMGNRLVLVVPKENPGDVHRPADLLKNSVRKVALAGENVPAGMYADQVFAKLHLGQPLAESKKIVRGQDVTTALRYVEQGEADAALVYASDVTHRSHVMSVYEFEAELHDPIVYVLMELKTDSANEAAHRFYEFLQSEDAKEVYWRFGFLKFDTPQ